MTEPAPPNPGPTPGAPQPPSPAKGARPKSFVPKSLPRVPQPPPKPRFTSIGGTKGLVIWSLTALSVLYFGWVAFSKYGDLVNRVFKRNVSSSYASRAEFLKSRFADIEKAAPDRRFGFFSPSTEPRVLKVYRDGDALVLDAGDARDSRDAMDAAKELDLFKAPGADLANLKIRMPPPRDPARVAAAAAELFEAVLDGAPDGVQPAGEMRLDDLPDKKAK